MFSSTLLTLLTSSTLALALPTGTSPSPLVRSELNLVRRNVKESDLSWIPGLNITYASPFNTSLPNVVIFATGGTIAGSSASNIDSTSYTAGVVGIEALIQAVPELLNVSNVQGSQIANVGSQDITSEIVLRMAKLANEILCSEGSTTDGLVITHGTDTLEETAFFMDSTVNCGKPVVVVGAMRPSTAISADGPNNLLSAVTLAASPEAKDRGAMIVLNDRIGSAWYTEKTNANTLDTFRALEQGYIGGFLSTKPLFFYPPAQATFKQKFNISGVDSLPMVDILYGHQDQDFHLVGAAVAAGAKGLVVAGTGAGSITSPTTPFIYEAIDAGVYVVASTKINNGAVVPDPGSSLISSGYLNPVKSRMQLQLAIATGMSAEETKQAFEGVLSGYLS